MFDRFLLTLIFSSVITCNISCRTSTREVGVCCRCSIIGCSRLRSHIPGSSCNCFSDIRDRRCILMNVRTLFMPKKILVMIFAISGTSWVILKKIFDLKLRAKISSTFLKYILFGLFCKSVSIPNAHRPRECQKWYQLECSPSLQNFRLFFSFETYQDMPKSVSAYMYIMQM
jgi:hypothetical protein